MEKKDQIERAARKCASKVLGIPAKDISPDDTIILGFKAGIEWAHKNLKPKSKRIRREKHIDNIYDYRAPGFNDHHNI